MTTFLGEEIADRFVDISEGRALPRGGIPGLIRDRQRLLNIDSDPLIYIVDSHGNILSTNFMRDRFYMNHFPLTILNQEKQVQKLKLNNQGHYNFYVVKTPIKSNDTTIGWVVIIQSEQDLTQVKQEYRLLAIMLISLALLGLGAIYILSRKLSKPIQNVALAAKQVQEGNYNIELSDDIYEQEVYELVHSFKEMAHKLEQLESFREELLAGVTHELKTPVTSISGLLQALKDDVVTGAEAKEFLDISLNEVNRMQKMVGDLLEFNSYVAQSIPVTIETYNINELINEIIHQWKITQGNNYTSIKLSLFDKPVFVNVDSMRLQQIIINLLNNSKHAMEADEVIEITLYNKKDGIIALDIKDNGIGIPVNEQSLIFERFYRGEHKKYKVRGLGLGLPFSKMIAKSIGGDLQLKESTADGSTFTLFLPTIPNN